MRRLNRRQFLTLSASSANAVVLAQCMVGQSRSQFNNVPSAPSQSSSIGGLLEIALEARYEAVNLANRHAWALAQIV